MADSDIPDDKKWQKHGELTAQHGVWRRQAIGEGDVDIAPESFDSTNHTTDHGRSTYDAIIEAAPAKQKHKYSTIIRAILENPNVVSLSDAGKLVLRGTERPQYRLDDLLYKTMNPRTTFDPAGYAEFIEAVSELPIGAYHFNNPDARRRIEYIRAQPPMASTSSNQLPQFVVPADSPGSSTQSPFIAKRTRKAVAAGRKIKTGKKVWTKY